MDIDVTMPDGTLIQGVPEGVTKSQLLAKYQKLSPALTDSGGDQYSTDPVRAAYQATMNNVAKPINNAVGGAFSALGSMVPQSIKDAGSYLLEKEFPVASKLAPVVAQAGQQEIKDLGSYNSDLAPDLSAFGENVKLAGSMAAIKPMAESIGNAGINVAKDRATIPSTQFPKAMAPEIPPLDPLAYHQEIGNSYGDAKKTAGKYYDFMQSLTEGKPAENVDKIGGTLNNIIEDISSDPLHEGRSQLGKLKLLSDKIDNGDFGLSDAVDLKKTLNTHFDPKRFSQSAGDVPYLKLGSTLDTSLAKSGEIYPDFGMAKDLSDRNWLNTVKKPFEDNPVLKKFWQPADYYNHLGVDEGRLDFLPDETAQRVDSLVKNIKNPSQLNALTRVVPEEQAAALKSEKLNDITQNQATSRLSAAGKVITGIPNIVPHPLTGTRDVLTNLGEVIGGPKLKPDQIALMKALKGDTPRLSDYSDQFNDLKNWSGQPRTSWLSPKALPAPESRLALSAPDDLMVSGSDGTRYMTPIERDYSLGLQSNPDVMAARGARAEQTPSKVLNTELMQRKNASDELSAWDNAAKNLSDQGYKYKEIEYKLGKRPEDLPEYSKGGSVHKNLTAEFLARASR